MSKVKSLVTATTIAVAASLAGGCIVHGSAGVAYEEPEAVDHRVVYVSPGVWVVENYHTPVFYSDGYYWERRGGYWYRSSYYNGGFVRVGYGVVPYRIRSVRRPSRYARYRARRGARYRSVRSYNRSRVRDRRRVNRRDRVRDRRFDRRSRVRDRRTNRRDRVRDRRSNRRDRVRDRRSNRRDRTRDRRKRRRTRDRRH